MLRYLLATNFCIRVLRDRPPTLRGRFNRDAESLCVSTIVLTELLHGAAKSARPDHNRGEVERFAARLEVLAFDVDAAGPTRPVTPPTSAPGWSGAARRSAATMG